MQNYLLHSRIVRIAYHLTFWLAYLVIWSIQDLVFHPVFWENFARNFLGVLGMAPLIYFNLYVLIPRYLLEKKYPVYLGILSILILLNTFLISLWTGWLLTPYFATMTGLVIILTDTSVLLTFSTVIKLVKVWYQKEKYLRELENKNHEIELNYLKAQINPHFLFNTLNNIYFSIPAHPHTAQDIILQLSDILSHQIYEARKQKVSLEKELDYLSKYIELEKVRQGDIVRVDYQFAPTQKDWMISPLLLLPFVENAFKHGHKTAPQGYWVKIKAQMQGRTLHFQVRNTFDTDSQPRKEGIGLENVKRRLALIYPHQHSLQINTQSYALQTQTNTHSEEQEAVFEVDLRIELEA